MSSVHQEELLANNAIGSGGTLNTNDSIAQIDSNYRKLSKKGTEKYAKDLFFLRILLIFCIIQRVQF